MTFLTYAPSLLVRIASLLSLLGLAGWAIWASYIDLDYPITSEQPAPEILAQVLSVLYRSGALLWAAIIYAALRCRNRRQVGAIIVSGAVVAILHFSHLHFTASFGYRALYPIAAHLLLGWVLIGIISFLGDAPKSTPAGEDGGSVETHILLSPCPRWGSRWWHTAAGAAALAVSFIPLITGKRTPCNLGPPRPMPLLNGLHSYHPVEDVSKILGIDLSPAKEFCQGKSPTPFYKRSYPAAIQGHQGTMTVIFFGAILARMEFEPEDPRTFFTEVDFASLPGYESPPASELEQRVVESRDPELELLIRQAWDGSGL